MQSPLAVTIENTEIGYINTSEDRPKFVWKMAEQRRTIIQNILHTVKIMTTNEVEDIFSLSSDGEDINREEQANRLVLDNLSNLRLYRIKTDVIQMYFVGQTEDGDWICIHTKAVET